MSFISWLKKLRRVKYKRKRSISAFEDMVNGPDAVHIRTMMHRDLAASLLAAEALKDYTLDDFIVRQDALVRTLEALDPCLCSCEDWLIAFRHLFRHRCLRAAGAARAKAVSSALIRAEAADADAGAWRLGFKAASERGDWKLAKTLLGQMQVSREISKDEKHRLQASINLQTGQVDVGCQGLLPNTGDFSQPFLDYLRGKSVAIVGPARSAELCGPEIDACDVVVRPNYTASIPAFDHARMGSRAHISFYANGSVKAAKVEESGSPLALLLSDLDWMIFKKRFVLHEDIAKSGKVVVGAVDDFMFHGSPNSIPFVAHTLLCYGPLKLKLFNSNFFFSKTPYADHYRKLPTDVQMHKRLGTLAAHDCLSQIHFMRNLANAGLIELNEESQCVVDMSPEAYLAGIETMWVHPGLAGHASNQEA